MIGTNRYVYPEFDYDVELETLKEEFTGADIASYYYDYDEEEYVVITHDGIHYPAALGPSRTWTQPNYKHRGIRMADIRAVIDHYIHYGRSGAFFYLNTVLRQYLDYREFKRLKAYITNKITIGGMI